MGMRASAEEEPWNWPYILYAGRCLLGYTDEAVMELTPRFFKAQLDVHFEIQSLKYGASKPPINAQQGMGFIDQIPGW